jgi:hypothetical protein
MPGPAPARTPAKQSRAAPAAITRAAGQMPPQKEAITVPEKQNGSEKQDSNSPGMVKGPRIISYNLDEDQRPGGLKVRFKIRIETGRKAAALNAQQAEAIRELLQWACQHQRPPAP